MNTFVIASSNSTQLKKTIPNASPNPNSQRNEDSHVIVTDKLFLEENSTQTIHTMLKEVAFCQDQKEVESRWNHIEKLLRQRKYEKNPKSVLQKLDEYDSYAAIHYAILGNNTYVCKKLLYDHKCDVNLLGYDGQAPLHLAASSSKLETEEELLNTSDERKDTLNNSVLGILLQHKKINVDIQDNNNRTPLHYAIMQNHIAIVKILLHKGAKTDIVDIQKATPIHYAHRFGDRKMIHIFPFQPEWLQMKTVDGKTPLDFAAELGYADIVEAYLNNTETSTDENHVIRQFIRAIGNYYGRPVLPSSIPIPIKSQMLLYWVCRQSHGDKLLSDKNIASILIKKSMISHQYEEDGFTPLMIAVKYRRVECVRTLISSKLCDKEILDKRSWESKQTVFHVCAKSNKDKITDLLLEEAKTKMDLNILSRDTKGDTPLHICARVNNIHMAMKLMQPPHSYLVKVTPQSKTSNSEAHRVTWKEKNNNGLTAFHEAVKYEHMEMVKEMLKSCDGHETLINETDRNSCTSLHMAAEKGNASIVEELLTYKIDVNACDINDHTALHKVAQSLPSDQTSKIREQCIKSLLDRGAELDAVNVRQETPLFIACRYASASLVKFIVELHADVLHTNLQGYNCLEVAIEERNEDVVEYLVGHDELFALMRNSQLFNQKNKYDDDADENSDGKFWQYLKCGACNKCRMNCKADTPMRKLIISMPDMAYKVLDRCTITLGDEGSKLHRKTYHFEFLEDQFSVADWCKKLPSGIPYNNEPYTLNLKTLVMNHPLFLMAIHNRYKLMSHSLSKSLVKLKFDWLMITIFTLSTLLYLAFLVIFTVTVTRVNHPQYYYNITGYKYDSSLCRNVTAALGNIDAKDSMDTLLQLILYILLVYLTFKNAWAIIGYVWFGWSKTLTFFLEIIALICNYYFMYDDSYQTKTRMRCPGQWQIGACGLFLGYIALLYYIKFIPVLGVYVIMMQVMLIRFSLFLPVFIVLIVAFGSAFFMLFRNFDGFDKFHTSLIKTAFMDIGEINYNDLMYNDKKTAYYEQISFIMLTLFAIIMVILVTNLLIGLAVGDIGPMLASAVDSRRDKIYELAADFEIFKYQIVWIFNQVFGCCHLRPNNSKHKNLNKESKWWKETKKALLTSCAREVDKQEDDDDDDDDERKDDQKYKLEEVRIGIQQLRQAHQIDKSNKKTTSNPQKNRKTHKI